MRSSLVLEHGGGLEREDQRHLAFALGARQVGVVDDLEEHLRQRFDQLLRAGDVGDGFLE
ncbi:MAG: hypothetical protein ACWGG5_02575 [Stenotrophomonas sp.]